MKRMRVLAVAPALFLVSQLFTASAGAALIYDETVDGEINDFNNPLGTNATPVDLMLGSNTVLGSSWAMGDVDFDFDDLILNVPVNGLLTDIILNVLSLPTVGSPTSVQANYSLYDGLTTGAAKFDLAAPTLFNGVSINPTTALFVSTLPLGAGSYLLDQSALAVINGTEATLNYEWEFIVAAVPLPPAAWLLISGLLAMVGLSRRQRGAAAA